MKDTLFARFTLVSALLLVCSLGIARPALAQQGAIQGTVRDRRADRHGHGAGRRHREGFVRGRDR